jgi:4-carboxymuconolactone decarboxylase
MTRGFRHLLDYAARMARGDLAGARRALHRARAARVPRVAAEETGLMLVLHAGYPAALEGLRVLSEAWPGKARRSREGRVARWRDRGERLCRDIYGGVYPRLIRRVRGMHPDLAVWMVEQGYGRVLSRPGLAARERELVAVAVLAAGGWERQLVSHLLGAMRMGAEREEIRTAVQAGVAGGAASRAVAGAWRAAFAQAFPER